MTKELKKALYLPIEDAEYALESVASALRTAVAKKVALPALQTAATKLLSMAAMDRDLRISRKVLNIEARRIAARLLAV